MKKKRLLASIMAATILFTMAPSYALADDSMIPATELIPATSAENLKTEAPLDAPLQESEQPTVLQTEAECTKTNDCTAKVHLEGCPAAACNCETLCTEENVKEDCPVCSAEEAVISEVCKGEAPAGSFEVPEVSDTSESTEPAKVIQSSTSVEELNESTDVKTIYVSASGDDTSDKGTADDPYASLAKAVEVAPAGQETIIYVMSDLTVNESARFWDNGGIPKYIIITSHPESLERYDKTAFTISRVETGFVAVNDQNRGGYNPGMFEVGNGSDLTLTHIILDDGHYAAYTDPDKPGAGTTAEQKPYFNQVASRSGDDDLKPGTTTIAEKEISNHKIVQDAMNHLF